MEDEQELTIEQIKDILKNNKDCNIIIDLKGEIKDDE